MTQSDSCSAIRPIVAINDSDLSDQPGFHSVLERMDLALHRFDLSAGWFVDSQLDQSAAVIISMASAENDSRESIAALVQRHADKSILVVAERCHAEVAFSIRSASSVILVPTPIDLTDLSDWLAHAVDRYQLNRNLQRTHADFERSLAMLTERQRQVLNLLTTGMPNKTIANRLGVSQRTVEGERARILKTFHSDSAADVAVRYGEYRILNKICSRPAMDDTIRPSMLGLRHRSLHRHRGDAPRQKSAQPVADSFPADFSASHANGSSH